MEIKGTGKRLIPKRDIDYLEELKANHSDPSASWGGTEVVANPTLAGTEPVLTGLQVGDNKYSIPEGGGSSPELYLHTINLIIRNGGISEQWVFAQICIINNSNTSMDYNSIYN